MRRTRLTDISTCGNVLAVQTFSAPEKEQEAVGQWIAERIKGGCEPHEIGVIIRSDCELKRARAAVKIAATRGSDLDEGVEPERGSVAIGTMHLAKGLEFKCVAVMACDDEIIPWQERIEASPTTPILRRFTTQNATCSMSPAPEPATAFS